MPILSYSLRSHGEGHLRFSNGIEQLGNSETMHRKVYRRALNNGAALVSDGKSGCDYGKVGEERCQECAEVQ